MEIVWAFSCIVALILGFYYGKYIEFSKSIPKKYESLSKKSTETSKKPKKFKESSEYEYLNKELAEERESKKKLVEQYETEINRLKAITAQNRKNFDEKLVRYIQERHAKTQQLFDEINSEFGPIIQIVDSSGNLSEDDNEKYVRV